MSTELTVGDDVVAVRSWGGKDRGALVTMMVSKEQWEFVKDKLAQTETGDYDIATAEGIVRDWASRGATIIWKTAADFNRDARELEQHRFRHDPEVAGGFDSAIQTSRDKAKSTTKASLKTVEDKMYTGDPLEIGGTSIAGNAAPAVRDLFTKGHIKAGMTVLDFGAGKYARNADFLRENGVKVYAYDPHHSLGKNGWDGVSNSLPRKKFDVVFTSFVLNVVPDHIETDILDATSKIAKQQFHITRNRDIFDTTKAALKRKDKLVGDFFLTHYANDEEKEMFAEGTIPDDIILDFCKHGVQTSRGFQRIPFLEKKGYSLVRTTSNFKIYKK